MLEFILELTAGLSPLTKILLVFSFGSIAFIGYNFVKNEKFRQSVFLNFRKGSDKINLLEHDLFFKMDYFKIAVDNVAFKDEKIKTDLFRILLNEKIKASIELTKQFITNLKIDDKIDFSILFFDLTVNVDNIIKLYEKRILTEFEIYFVQKGYNLRDAKEIAHQQYNLLYLAFKKNHNKSVEFILKNLKRNIFSEAFTPQQKLYFYLNLIDMALEIAITDCEETFVKLNGGVVEIIRRYVKIDNYLYQSVFVKRGN